MTISRRRALALPPLVFLAACAGQSPPTGADAHATATLAHDAATRFTWRGTSAPVLAASTATIAITRDGLDVSSPPLPLASIARPARVMLPTHADGPAHIEDRETGLAVDVSLVGASAVPASIVSGHAIYPGVREGIAMIHRPTAEGTEDYLLLDHAPTDAVSYRLDLGDAVSGLRLVERTLELLDPAGIPRLRMGSPYVVDADRRRREVDVSLSGCRFDDSPIAPYGRPVITPGARDCVLTLRLGPDVAYPALLDPTWTTTGSMVDTRSLTRPAMLGDGRVLIAGGFLDLSHTPTAHAEIYDPASRTFTATGPMKIPRVGVLLTTLDDGRVLAFAGHDDGTIGTTPTAEIYDAKTGIFMPTGSAPEGRDSPFAVKVHDGRIFVGGGCVLNQGSSAGCSGDSLDTTVLFDPKAGSWSSGPKLNHIRHSPTATVLPTGDVLVAGGDLQSAMGTDTGELIDPALTAFSMVGDFADDREFAASVLLPDGRVLIVGGFSFDGDGNLLARASTAVYLPSQKLFATGPTLSAGLYAHSLYSFPSGTIAVPTGCDSIGTPIASARLTNGSLAGWKPDAKLPHTARLGAVTIQLQNSVVLAAGGLDIDDQVLATAELYGPTCATAADCDDGYCASSGTCAAKKAAADTCAADVECTTGICADGHCCNNACVGQCEACNVAGSVGTCVPVVGPPVGARGGCKGSGVCGGACDGVDRSACTNPGGSTSCGASCAADESNVYLSGVCGGDGTCGTTSIPCGVYRCRASGCPTSCATTDDCTSGYICDSSQKCSPKPTASASCADDHTVALADGSHQDCAPYGCVSPGVCLTTCDSSQQCVTGSSCNAMRACTPRSAATPDDGSSGGCGCTVPSGSSGSWGALLGLALSLASWRRRRACNPSV